MEAVADKTNIDISSLAIRGHDKTLDPLLNEIYEEMPILGKQNFSVGRVNYKSEHGGAIEFFNKNEPDNPTGGPYVELYSDAPTKKGELQDAIKGDMLHHLSYVDPYWKSLRDQYMADRPARVKAMDRRAYEGSGDKRSYEKWEDVSRADAHIRAGILGYENWKNVPRTERQEEILKTMNLYLRTGKRD